MGMFDTTGNFLRRNSASGHAPQSRADEEGAAARGAGPRADQRFLLGRLHPPLAGGTRPAGGRQSLLLLRPRLDRHGAQHGPLDPLLRDPQGERPRRSWSRRATGRSCARSSTAPCPSSSAWETDTLEKARGGRVRRSVRPRGVTSRPATTRLAGVGDGFERNSPPWVETVKSLWPDFPVYGSMVECSECMTRLIGPQNHMLWMALEPERFGAVLNRVGRVLSRLRQGGHRRRRPLAGRVRHLGRRGLQEGHVHAARLLADLLQAVGQGDRRSLPRPRAWT